MSYNHFKTEYIAELMIAGYTKEQAEEQYKAELKEIELANYTLEEEDFDNFSDSIDDSNEY